MRTETVNILLKAPRSFGVTVLPEGEGPLSSRWGFSVRIEDEGEDVTAQVCRLTLRGDTRLRRQWAEVELIRDGFDGPFCTPAVPF